MWPWEHLAVGYIAFSLLQRARDGRGVRTSAAVALALGTQLPDLVDKLLGWGLGVLPGGRSLGHSLLFVVPVVVVGYLVARHLGRRDVGTAFAVGYLFHLPGDMAYPALLGGDVAYRFLLWPIVPAPESEPVTILGRTLELLTYFTGELTSSAGPVYIVFEALLLGTALVLWLRDGHPGLPTSGRRRTADENTPSR
ncbi:metal-dependent hydrolase [Halomicroarcula sp. GCM10025817]|uniref:metal-dependent hydrolase n=1 Tax=Haloarcula TaxID=2237 RepID=UPI0023E768B2|nr:metal-dependent hydrolase [Halomicroarcula sp. SYNS111]